MSKNDDNLAGLSATGATVLLIAVILFIWNVALGLGQINEKENGIYCMKSQTFFGPIKTLCSTSKKELETFDTAKSNPINRIPIILTAIYDDRVDIGTEVYKAFMGPNTWIEKESMFGNDNEITEEQSKQSNSNDPGAKYDSCQLGDLIGDNVEYIEYKGATIQFYTDEYTKDSATALAQACEAEGANTPDRLACCAAKKMFPSSTEPALY